MSSDISRTHLTAEVGLERKMGDVRCRVWSARRNLISFERFDPVVSKTLHFSRSPSFLTRPQEWVDVSVIITGNTDDVHSPLAVVPQVKTFLLPPPSIWPLSSEWIRRSKQTLESPDVPSEVEVGRADH